MTAAEKAVEWSKTHPKGSQSFYLARDGHVECDACGIPINNPKPSNLKRHCGEDEKQNGTNGKGSNNGARHKAAIAKWRARQNNLGAVVVPREDMALMWGRVCLKAGLNASQCAAVAKGWSEACPFEGHGTLPKNRDAARTVFNQVAQWLRRQMQHFDKNQYYSLIIDASPDEHECLEVTLLLVVTDPRKKPFCPELTLSNLNADNESVADIVLDALIVLGWPRFVSVSNGKACTISVAEPRRRRWTSKL